MGGWDDAATRGEFVGSAQKNLAYNYLLLPITTHFYLLRATTNKPCVADTFYLSALFRYHYAYERAIREEQHLVGIHLVVRNAVKHCEVVVLGSLITT